MVLRTSRNVLSGTFACVVLLLPGKAGAGMGVWTTGGPYGGQVRALAIDPGTPSTLYAGTSFGGGVFKSVDRGTTWTAASAGLTHRTVNSLAIDPATPSVLYVATDGGGVFRSANGSATWAAASTGLPSPYVSALAIDPLSHTRLYAGWSSGVYKTTNSGTTWGATTLTQSIYSLAVDPVNVGTVYAGTGSAGVWKSTDAGASWTPVSTGLPSYAEVLGLAICPAAPATVYAALYGRGVYRTTNGGGSWTLVNASPYVQGLAIEPAQPSVVYFGALADAVYRSSNGGSSWTRLAGSDPYVGTLAIDPVAPTRLYAGSLLSGVLRSVDSGQTWSAASAGLAARKVYSLATSPTTPGLVYAGSTGVFRSTDSGASWMSMGLENFTWIDSLAVDPKTPSTVYAGTDGYGVYRSTDAGATWTNFRTGLTDLYVVALAVDPVQPWILYAGTSDGVFKSFDWGGSWYPVNAGIEPYPGLENLYVNSLAIDPKVPSTLYASTEFSGIFKSTDSGASWTAASAGLGPYPYVQALALDPKTPSTVYAGTWDGVYRSLNGGASWTAVNTGLGPHTVVKALAIDPQNPATIYTATESSGVFRSIDRGLSWTPVNKGLPSLETEAVAVSHAAGTTTLYVGLSGGGVWQAGPPAGADADLSITLADSPDPVLGTTPLSYTIGVTNAGSGTTGSVAVSHTLPLGTEFLDASGTGWTCSHASGVVTCTYPGLGVGTAPSLTVRTVPGPTATVLASSATVSAPESDPDLADNTATETTTVLTPLVWMGTRTKTVTADAGEFIVNAGVTYTITLANAGAQAQADNPGHELVDTLPASLVYTPGSATASSGTLSVSADTVAWDGSLPSGGSVTISFQATIGPRVALGTVVSNQATVSYDADGNGTNDATALTDDPGQPGTSDPTSFLVVSPTMDFYTLEPCRLLDTRNATGTFGGPALVAGTDRVFPLFGSCGIPATARALSVNLTVTQPSAQGNLRLYPAGTPLPLVSNVNYSAGQTRANNAVAPLNGLGELAIRCSQASGQAHVIVDVNGYFE